MYILMVNRLDKKKIKRKKKKKNVIYNIENKYFIF